MAEYKDMTGYRELFDEEYKKTRKLISQGKTHLDNLAEGFTEADMVICKIPTADVVEVRRGEWNRCVTGNGWDYWEELICPFCEKKHEKPRFKMNFCPSCGADMRGDTNGKAL